MTVEENTALLDWTAKQGRILTCDGKATSFYTKDRGYPFEKEELPHHHLISQSTEIAFSTWASNEKVHNPVCGAFYRPLFVGGFEHSTDKDEISFNVQTNTLFIDIRIPRLGQNILKGVDSFNSMSDEQIQLFARRHAFSGYTRLQHENNRPVCTRHHCIDWNFVGVPRPRPNKWYVEMNSCGNVWKEWAYAKDDFQQHYYSERWERLKRDGKGNGLVLAMRKERTEGNDRDGIIVVVGDHFSYILGRNLTGNEKEHNQSSTVDLVDEAIAKGDRTTAEKYLSIDAGHGFVSKGWEIDCALQHWKEGTKLFDENEVCVSPSNLENTCQIQGIENSNWEILESNVDYTALDKVFHIRTGTGDGIINNILFGATGKKRDVTTALGI